MKADVYRNLNKDGKFSLRSREEEDYGKVISHKEIIKMKNCSFVVQDSGYDRYQETGHKNVHAFVRGEVVEADNFINYTIEEKLFKEIWNRTRVMYNPDFNDYFYTSLSERVHSSEDAILIIDRVYAKNPQPLT